MQEQKLNDDWACRYDPCCLGMCKWTDCIGAKINPQLHLPSTNEFEPHPTASKFEPHPTANELFEFADEETLVKFSKGLTPANTGRSTKGH